MGKVGMVLVRGKLIVKLLLFEGCFNQMLGVLYVKIVFGLVDQYIRMVNRLDRYYVIVNQCLGVQIQQYILATIVSVCCFQLFTMIGRKIQLLLLDLVKQLCFMSFMFDFIVYGIFFRVVVDCLLVYGVYGVVRWIYVIYVMFRYC